MNEDHNTEKYLDKEFEDRDIRLEEKECECLAL